MSEGQSSGMTSEQLVNIVQGIMSKHEIRVLEQFTGIRSDITETNAIRYRQFSELQGRIDARYDALAAEMDTTLSLVREVQEDYKSFQAAVDGLRAEIHDVRQRTAADEIDRAKRLELIRHQESIPQLWELARRSYRAVTALEATILAITVPTAGINFQLMLTMLPDAALIVNATGSIVIANEFAADIFGYSIDDLTTMLVEDLIPPRYRDQHLHDRAAYSEAPYARRMGRGIPLYGLRKDGSEFAAEISLAPLVHATIDYYVVAIIRERV